MKQDRETQHLLHNNKKMEPNPFQIEAHRHPHHHHHHLHFAKFKNSSKNLRSKTWDESKKMWEIAAPAILTIVSQFSIGFVTVAFVGHLGEVELAAVSVVQNVLEGFVFGIMVTSLLVIELHYIEINIQECCWFLVLSVCCIKY